MVRPPLFNRAARSSEVLPNAGLFLISRTTRSQKNGALAASQPLFVLLIFRPSGDFTAAACCSAVMAPVASMRFSTRVRRASACSGRLVGSYPNGLRTSPASVADCCKLSRLAGTEKKRREAVSTP